MHECRHCSHQNADHLAYCSQCGKRVAGATLLPVLGNTARGQMAALSPTAALSRTMLAQPSNGVTGSATVGMIPGSMSRTGGTPTAVVTSRLGWAVQSIGYIYVFARGKMAAGERRKRLIEERDGAQTLLAGAIRDLGLTVLREGVQHPDLTGLLEAIGRAEARREGAIADLAASEHQKVVEEGRLAEQETALEREWKAADGASREADDVMRAATAEQATALARLRRVRDERARLEREAEAAESAAGGETRIAHLKHESEGLVAEARTIEEQMARLDPQLADLRDKSTALRAASGAARSKLDESIASRRQSAAAMAASVAGHVRERATAEREGADLTVQLGRATMQARPAVSSLLSVFQRIDRLQETIVDRTRELEALERAAAHYDQRKLLTGVSLVTVLLGAGVAALWLTLRR
jgi:predicted  nucleic acid-binding Zn-ribbon protein